MIAVSVLMPLYNSARYMRQSIENVVQSTLDNIELILIDDCSPDNSLEIANEYKLKYPEKVRVIHHEVNKRCGGALNTGIKAAQGEYVIFLAPDDWMDVTMLEKLYSVACEKNCDVVDCDYYTYYQNSGKMILMRSMAKELEGDVTEEVMEHLVRDSGRFSCKIIRRENLLKYELFFPENILYEDNGIGPLQLLGTKRVGKVNEPLFFYRTENEESQTGRKWTKKIVQDRQAAMDYLYEKSKQLGVYDRFYDALEYRYTEIYYLSTLDHYFVGDLNYGIKELKAMKLHIKDRYPNYYKYKYAQIYEIKSRIIMGRLNDFSPILLKLARFLYRETRKKV